MLTVVYESQQAILEEAGLQNRVMQEVLSGAVDGANKSFTTAYGPIADSNYNDQVDSTDLVVFVNGVKAAVASVDETNQIITLSNAPATNAVVTANYWYSAVPASYVSRAREEAQDLIDTTVAAVDPVPYSQGQVPPTVRKMTRVYAAGLLLTRDYGSGRDIAETSKDGYKKLQLVEGNSKEGAAKVTGWLEQWVNSGGLTGGSQDLDDSDDVLTQPNIFTGYDRDTGRYTNSSTPLHSVDSDFMLGLDFED